MNKISSIKTKFQSFLETLIYIFRLCLGALPEVEPRPFICYESAYDRKVKKLTESVRAFNAKKQGGAAK